MTEAQVLEPARRDFTKKEPTRICVRCIMDTSVPGIAFDNEGVCNFCKVHDRLEKEFPLNKTGEKRLGRIISKIKRDGRKKKYDCVIGISGGRDSTYTLYLAKRVWGLRPLAVHFNDGFGNPIAGENMVKTTRSLGVELRTITSDWRESKDLKVAFLKASTPDLEQATDIGIAAALYAVAAKENLKAIIIGQSFRTEGIAPLSWNYLDGRYLEAVHREFGTVKLRPWRPQDPGFHLNLFHILYYTLWKGIKTFLPLYLINYVRREAEEIIRKELDWIYPGAHYYDDLYQSMMTYILRTKFKIDRRLFNYSALVRSGQMARAEAMERIKEVYVIEDPKVIGLCVKRLGITQDELEEYFSRPVKTFRDYPNHCGLLKAFKPFIKLLSSLSVLPGTAYDKYFNCGK